MKIWSIFNKNKFTPKKLLQKL